MSTRHADLPRAIASLVLTQRPPLRWLAAFCSAFVLGAGFAKWFSIVPWTGVSIWLPAGLLLATLLLARPATWPWWLLAGLAAELLANALWFRNPLAVALLLNVGNALCGMTGAWLAIRFGEAPLRLERPHDVLLLVILGMIAPIVAATIGAATLSWFQAQPFAKAWVMWWVGDATGVLLMAPLVLVALQSWNERAVLTPMRTAEAGLIVLLLVGMTALSLRDDLLFSPLITPILLWSAVRFEFRGAVAALAVLALTTAVLVASDAGLFAGPRAPSSRMQLMLQLLLAVSAVSALLVAAFARQHREGLRTLQRSRDELERRVAQRTAELQQSEARFRILADSAPISIWVTDADGAIEFVNREYERFFGVGEREVRLNGWRPLLHPDDERAYADAFYRAQRERVSFQAEAQVRRADGQWRYVASLGSARFSAAGGFLGMVGTTLDITERKRSEDALAVASRQKDDFVATLAHELRNPLAPIRNATQLLRLAGATSPTVETACAMIERQVAHMVRLVDDLMDVSRAARGRLALRHDRLDLAEVARQAVDMHRAFIEARGHRLALSLPGLAVTVNGDAMRLAQAIANLVHNAAKYTEPGGRIEVAVARESVGESPMAVVRVRDDGRGIDADAAQHVFDMFYQSPEAAGHAEGGLGIGLSLVRRLVELHGGTVEAASEGRGRGSEFVIRLPLDARPTTPAAPATGVAATPPLAPGGLRTPSAPPRE